jgi:hypothetical protein
MPRPPKSMTGVHWRSEDGSDNLGKAGMPYARSVLKTEIDFDLKAEDVFDLLLRRKKDDVCVYQICAYDSLIAM